MNDFRVAAVTLTPSYLDVPANLRAICDWSVRAADAGANLVIFPEASLSGYDLEAMEQTAVAIDEPEVRAIIQLAEKRKIVIGFGLLERAPEGVFITQLYVGPGVRQRHRKCHLTSWDRKYCQSGDELEVQDIGVAKLGTLICYDSAFPAASEALARKGAEVLVQPSCHGMWVRDVPPQQRPMEFLKRRNHILKYWRARAYDYTCYAIYVDHSGVTSRGEWFPGYVGIFGPDGEIIAESKAEGEQMVLANLTDAFLQDNRRRCVGHFGTLSDARPELYWPANQMPDESAKASAEPARRENIDDMVRAMRAGGRGIS
jgi:beta-ureidopropionase